MDQDRLIGADKHTITKGEMDAWKRGENDAAKNKLLRASTRLSVSQAIALIRMYSELGDVHYITTRFDTSADEVRSILRAFGVSSIEDAKKIVREGTIAELDAAEVTQRDEDEATRRVAHIAAQAIFEAGLDQPVEEPTQDEKDKKLAKRQDEAQTKNKQDQIRALIAEGIDPKTNTSDMRIPLASVAEFKSMIPYGVSQLKRRFGGTDKDIVSEIKRLSPSTHIDMLRP